MELTPDNEKLDKALSHLKQTLEDIKAALSEIEETEQLNDVASLQGDFNILRSIDWKEISNMYIPEVIPTDEKKTLFYWFQWIIGVIVFLIQVFRTGRSNMLADQLMGLVENEHYGYFTYNARLLYGPIDDFNKLQSEDFDEEKFRQITDTLTETIEVMIRILEKYRNNSNPTPLNDIIES